MTARRIAVIGSREYVDLEPVRREVRALPSGVVVVTGAWWERGVAVPTRGVDRAAALEASMDHVVVLVVGPLRAGKAAGIVRNPITAAIADELLAFQARCNRPDHVRLAPHGTHGTDDTLAEARSLGRPVRIFGPDGQEIG